MASPEEQRRAERRRLAGELRRIIDRMTIVDAPPEELAQAADTARTFADRLEEILPPRRGAYEGYAEAALAGSPEAFFDRSPIIGQANPLAAPITLEVVREGDESYIQGHAVFGTAYEGPPGCLHGGFVAAAFDELLGLTQSLSGLIGMTGTLTVRYRNPTPLYTELRFRGALDRVEGRKIFVTGTCHAGDRLTAEADGIFIAIDFERIRDLISERESSHES